MPFGDELKTFDWGAPPSADGPSAAQLQAASDLIDSFDLKEEKGAGDDEQTIKPKQVFNPKLQRHWQCIQHRARAMLASEGSASATSPHLPPPAWRITKPLQPDPAVLLRATPSIDAFAAACPLGEATAGGKRKSGGTGGAAPAKAAKAETAAFGGGGGGGGDVLALGYVPSQIDSAAPVNAFWQMLGDEKEDRTDAALAQMAAVVLQLMREVKSEEEVTWAQGPFQKGLAALREFRRGSLQNCCAKEFNGALRTIRELYHDESSGRAFLWRAVVAQIGEGNQLKKGLIVHDEVEGAADGSVSEEEARAFWEPPAAQVPEPAAPASAPPPNNDDAMEDDLDDLE